MKTKLRLRVEAIEGERRRRGGSQVEFAERCSYSVSGYRKILGQTRADKYPNNGSDLMAGILTALGHHRLISKVDTFNGVKVSTFDGVGESTRVGATACPARRAPFRRHQFK